MVEIQSKEIIDKMSDELKVQPAMTLPRELGKMIVPTYSVNPIRIANIVEFFNKNNTGTSTIFTTPADRDFFLTGASISGSADVLYDGLTCRVSGTLPNGAAVDLIMSKNRPLVVFGNVFHSRDYTHPIKLKKGSTITVTLSFAAGTPLYSIVIQGYTTDPQ